MKMIDCMLCTKINTHKTTIQHSWQRNISNYWSIRMMKSISARSKISNNHQVRLQKSAIFHDNKKVEQMIDMMSRNFNRIWLCHSTLQRKKQQLSRHSEQKTEFYQKRRWKTRTNNAASKSKWITRICTLQNHMNRRIFEWTNQEKNLARQIYKKNNQKN